MVDTEEGADEDREEVHGAQAGGEEGMLNGKPVDRIRINLQQPLRQWRLWARLEGGGGAGMKTMEEIGKEIQEARI